MTADLTSLFLAKNDFEKRVGWVDTWLMMMMVKANWLVKC